MSTILKKIDEACSNVQLIDENTCLADSYGTINHNMNALTSGVNAMINSVSAWSNAEFLSNFYSISGDMINSMLNIQTIEKYYISPYTTIQNLSSKWNYKQFSLYYPSIINFDDYYYQPNVYNNYIKFWLTENFSPNSFGEGQIVNIFLTLNYINTFSYSFNGSYQENCSPTANSDNTLSCNGCGGDNRMGGCNHDVGGRHWCDNAYTYCKVGTISDDEVYSCLGRVNGTFQWISNNILSQNTFPFYAGTTGSLSIDYNWNDLEDTFVARIIKFVYQNQNNTWVLQTS